MARSLGLGKPHLLSCSLHFVKADPDSQLHLDLIHRSPMATRVNIEEILLYYMWSEKTPTSRRTGTLVCTDTIDGHRGANPMGYEEYPASGRSPDAMGLLYAPQGMVDEVARQAHDFSLRAGAEWHATRERAGRVGSGRKREGHVSNLFSHLQIGAQHASQVATGVFACVQLGVMITSFVSDEVVCEAHENEFHQLRLFTIKAQYSPLPYGIDSVHVPLLMVDAIHGIHQSYEVGISGIPTVHSVGMTREELSGLRDEWRCQFMALRSEAEATRDARAAKAMALSASGVIPGDVASDGMEVVESIPWGGSLTEDCSSPMSSDGGADEAAAEAAVASARGRREVAFPPHAGAGPEPAAAAARRVSGRVTGAPDRLQVGHVLFSSPFGQGEEGMPTLEEMGSPPPSPVDQFEEYFYFSDAFDAD